MPLQRCSTEVYLAVLRFPRVDTRYHDPSCTVWAWAKSQAISHSSEQDTLPIIFLISKQAIPYRTRGGTCCPGVTCLALLLAGAQSLEY
jgi:hypothetical protein